jgi:hypothetical protein
MSLSFGLATVKLIAWFNKATYEMAALLVMHFNILIPANNF